MELVDAIPDMKLVFDTANPAFNRDHPGMITLGKTLGNFIRMFAIILLIFM